jgi:hypothetical protein
MAKLRKFRPHSRQTLGDKPNMARSGVGVVEKFGF